MHTHLELILTLTGGLTAALILGFLTHRVGLSPIVGYLLAGVAVGPNTPGFVANDKLAGELAEVGVILLMFGVGLHFHLKELLAVRRVAVPGAVGQSLLATLLGLVVGQAAGWGWAAGVVFGLAVSVASTVVLLRVLADNNDLHTPAGHIAVGWLVVEDLFTVFVLVLMPVLFLPGAGGFGGVALATAWAAVKIGLLVAFVVLVGGRAVPWVLARVDATRSRELFTLTVLVIALGVAVGAAVGFGVSMALGAFLAGMVVGRSDFSARAASEALPMRDAFAVLFFVSVGMLFDPVNLVRSPGLIAATLGIILVGKPVAALAIVLALRYPPRVALSVAVALAQIGEFSFILASLGRELKVLPDEGYNVLVAAAIVSISLNPILYRLVEFAERRGRWLSAPPTGEVAAAPAAEDVAVVVGHGPVGRTLVRLLRDNEIEPSVIELNRDTVERLRAEGIRAVYGDAAHQATLDAAGVGRARALLLTASSLQASEEVVRLARQANPRIRVFARVAYLREAPALRRAGADVVFSGEGEVALAMTEFLLRRLGATNEQIDRERDRVRGDLFGGVGSGEAKPATPAAEGEPRKE